VLTRLNYGDSVFASLLVYLACRLQSVLNKAVRLTYHLHRSDHITDAPPLAARAEASPAQECRSNVQSLAWTRDTGIPWSTQLLRRPTWPTTALFSYHQPSGSASGQVDNCLQPTAGPRTWNDLPDDVESSRCPSSASVSQFTFSPNHFLDCALTNLSSGPNISSRYLGTL